MIYSLRLHHCARTNQLHLLLSNPPVFLQERCSQLIPVTSVFHIQSSNSELLLKKPSSDMTKTFPGEVHRGSLFPLKFVSSGRAQSWLCMCRCKLYHFKSLLNILDTTAPELNHQKINSSASKHQIYGACWICSTAWQDILPYYCRLNSNKTFTGVFRGLVSSHFDLLVYCYSPSSNVFNHLHFRLTDLELHDTYIFIQAYLSCYSFL